MGFFKEFIVKYKFFNRHFRSNWEKTGNGKFNIIVFFLVWAVNDKFHIFFLLVKRVGRNTPSLISRTRQLLLWYARCGRGVKGARALNPSLAPGVSKETTYSYIAFAPAYRKSIIRFTSLTIVAPPSVWISVLCVMFFASKIRSVSCLRGTFNLSVDEFPPNFGVRCNRKSPCL